MRKIQLNAFDEVFILESIFVNKFAGLMFKDESKNFVLSTFSYILKFFW